MFDDDSDFDPFTTPDSASTPLPDADSVSSEGIRIFETGVDEFEPVPYGVDRPSVEDSGIFTETELHAALDIADTGAGNPGELRDVERIGRTNPAELTNDAAESLRNVAGAVTTGDVRGDTEITSEITQTAAQNLVLKADAALEGDLDTGLHAERDPDAFTLTTTDDGSGGDGGDAAFVDDRAVQATLGVSDATQHRQERDTAAAGTDEFVDARDTIDSMDDATQAALTTEIEAVGDGQMDLSGGTATETRTPEWQTGDGGGGDAWGKWDVETHDAARSITHAPEPLDATATTTDNDNSGANSGSDDVTIEFGGREFANEFRDDFDDYLSDDDDRRTQTVVLDSDAPDWVESVAGDEALISFSDEHETVGQTKLSRDERNRLDSMFDQFSWKNHGFEAMRAKSAALSEGVPEGDWLGLYEPGEGADGVLSRIEKQKKQDGERGSSTGLVESGVHREQERSRGDIARQVEQARGAAEKHAVEGAKEGHEEAKEALRREHGWTDAEIRRLTDMVDDDSTPFTEEDIKRIEDFERSQTSGMMVAVPTTRAENPPGRRSPPSGQYAPPPSKREDPGVVRDADSGRFREPPDN